MTENTHESLPAEYAFDEDAFAAFIAEPPNDPPSQPPQPPPPPPPPPPPLQRTPYDTKTLLMQLYASRVESDQKYNNIMMCILQSANDERTNDTGSTARSIRECQEQMRQQDRRIVAMEENCEKLRQAVGSLGQRLNVILDCFREDIAPWMKRVVEAMIPRVPTLPSAAGIEGYGTVNDGHNNS